MRKFIFCLTFLFFSSPLFPFNATIIVVGPPGSGKGSFSQLLKENHNYCHISAGDLVRNEINKKTPTGLSIEAIVKRGEFIDKAIMYKLIGDRIKENKGTKKPLIIDGFARDPKDMDFLYNLLMDENLLSVSFIFFIDAPDDVCKERILYRAICNNCGHVYNTKTNPPYVEGKCDICNAFLNQRINDTKEVIEKRLRDYRNVTEATYKSFLSRLPHILYNTNKPKEENIAWYTSFAKEIDAFQGDAAQFVSSKKQLIS